MYDYILVGGGLQNALISLAVLDRRPTARIAMVERAPRLGGNHTWCFHADDVPDELGDLIGPLVVHRWPGYRVEFPRHARDLESPYAAITSERLDHVVRSRFAEAPHAELLLGEMAMEVDEHRVELLSGRTLAGRVVIDARGPSADDVDRAGYQKFVGLELQLEEPHYIDRPLLMDATVPQIDGFRFVYVLPLAPDRLLVEDTYFSDDPTLDTAALVDRVLDYADDRGWQVESVVRDEQGVLPLPWELELTTPAHGPLVAGYRGGWFHPVTGYSLPAALELARYVGAADPEQLFGDGLVERFDHQRTQLRFGMRLNRMLFHWFAPHQRFNVLERFYRLPEPVIRRFYALRLGFADRMRILVGRPPRGMSWRVPFTGGAQ